MIESSAVARILARWRNTYPEDVFPPSSVSYECKAAKLARHVLEEAAKDISELPSAWLEASETEPLQGPGG